MIVSDEKMQKALHYLAETDEPAAVAHALYGALKEQVKTILSDEFLKARADTVKEREAIAYSSSAYREHLGKIQDAFADYETMRNKRITADAIIQAWRSLNRVAPDCRLWPNRRDYGAIPEKRLKGIGHI